MLQFHVILENPLQLVVDNNGGLKVVSILTREYQCKLAIFIKRIECI